MHHIPQFFTRRKRTGTMDPRNRRGARLERRNAAKHIDYDYEAASSISSLTDSSSSSSLVTRSLDLSDRTSFRMEGTDGEFDRICRVLGLSGPEDFAIPTAAWEAMKVRSSSDILPLSRYGLNSLKVKEVIPQEQEQEQEQEEEQQEIKLCARVFDTVRIGEDEATESAELKTCCPVGGGIKGVRPPLLKPPPSMSLPLMDDKCSTWDILRDFAPESERASFKIVNRDSSSDDEEDKIQGSEVGEERQGRGRAQAIGAALNHGRLEVVDENLLSSEGSYSFSTSNDDDSSSTTTDPTNISPNMRFRRSITDWEKGGLLGRGSFGSVYEGISDDGFFFAVKEVSLLDQGSQGKQSILQLEQEIALLSWIEHENIVQYYGTDKDESKLYIFLELVTKGSLLNLYQTYNLRDSQVSAYTRQILHGLKYLHDQNVVHRDIKCANILVDANGSVKLADFGLAKATKFNDVKSCKGTALWMAPEVVNRKNQGYGLPADIWSLGCTVLEMLTRQLPYSHLESMQAIFRIGRGELPPVPDSLSPDARDFILQCLRVNPDDRPTAAQLLGHAFVKRPLSTNSGSASPYIGRRS